MIKERGIIMKDFTKCCGIYFEHSIDDAEWSYNVIFGYHINGAFIAVPNWKVSCEASDDLYNSNESKLIEAGLTEQQASKVAGHINVWLEDNEKFVKKCRKEQQKLYCEYINRVTDKG
jgi:hypothetical protein|nr:MAG TPA: hypothetical protein [Inoviridae sp.]